LRKGARCQLRAVVTYSKEYTGGEISRETTRSRMILGSEKDVANFVPLLEARAESWAIASHVL